MPANDNAVFTGNIPANYDRYLGPMLFEPFAIDMVERIKTENPGQVLELACGTGRVTAHLINMLDESGKLTATDLNPDMIAVAKEKIKQSNITWQVVDAQELPYEPESFDGVVCQFGVMFFPDKLKAFKEAYRVLQKSGKFVFNTWDSLEVNMHSHIVQKVLREWLKDKAPDFMEKGPFSFFDAGIIRQLLEQAGFTDIKIYRVQKTAHYQSDDNIIKGFLEGSPLATFINKLDEGLRHTIKEKVAQEIISTFGKGNHEFPMQALVCTASK